MNYRLRLLLFFVASLACSVNPVGVTATFETHAAVNTTAAPAQGIGRNIYAPEIIIISPDQDSVVIGETVIFTGVILSYKFPLTDVTFSLNRQEIKGPKLTAETRKRLSFEIPVQLNAGSNVLSVTARNEKAAHSETRMVALRTSSAKPNLAVLAIGISKYKDPATSVRFAAADAIQFAERIKKQEGCIFANIKTNVLLNEAATREGIIEGLRWLNETAPQDSDVRILYFAGRNAKDFSGAFFILSAQHDSEKQLELYDVRYELIFDRLAAVRNRAIVFMDTAYGGRTRSFRAGPEQFTANPSGTILAYFSSAGNQPSFESEAWGHSAFSTAIFEALAGNPSHFQNKNINTDELHKWISTRVSDLTDQKQRPVFVADLNDKPIPVFCKP